MQFIIIAYDGTDPDAINRRMATREAHLKNGDLMKERGELLYGVAMLDENQKMVGSVYVVDLPSRIEVDAWLKIEPYVLGNVWDKIEISPCRVGPSFLKAL